MSITLLDLPFQLIFPAIFAGIVYPMSGQIQEVGRLFLFILICCLAAIVAQSIGLMIATWFAESMNLVVFLAPVSSIPAFLFSGFFVRISSMPTYLRPLTYISYIKYALQAYINVIYGMDRCAHSYRPYQGLEQHEKLDQFVNQTVSQDYGYPSTNFTIGDNPGNLYLTYDGLNQSQEEMAMTTVSGLGENSGPENYDDHENGEPSYVMKMAYYYDGYNRKVYTNSFSYVMVEFGLEGQSEWQVWQDCLILVLFSLVLRTLSFLLLLRKAHSTR